MSVYPRVSPPPPIVDISKIVPGYRLVNQPTTINGLATSHLELVKDGNSGIVTGMAQKPGPAPIIPIGPPRTGSMMTTSKSGSGVMSVYTVDLTLERFIDWARGSSPFQK